MTLVNAGGSLVSKEVYKYEYDSVGNWVKMTTSVAVVENGRIGLNLPKLPTEQFLLSRRRNGEDVTAQRFSGTEQCRDRRSLGPTIEAR